MESEEAANARAPADNESEEIDEPDQAGVEPTGACSTGRERQTVDAANDQCAVNPRQVERLPAGKERANRARMGDDGAVKFLKKWGLTIRQNGVGYL